MRLRLLRQVPILVGLLVYSAALSGQAPAYHIELSDGKSGWVIFTNDSQKTVEAFHFEAVCGPGTDAMTQDVLSTSGEILSHPVEPRGQTGVIKPGEHFYMLMKLLVQQSGCTWSLKIPALIYADGSYEGDYSSVRELQVKRDGIASAAHFWLKKLEEDAGYSFTDQMIAEQAERVADEAKTKMKPALCHNQPFHCSYWQGISQVDNNVVLSARRGHLQVSQEIARWCRKIEADQALKKLDSLFPLPPELAAAYHWP